MFELTKNTIKSPIGLKEGALSTLLIVTYSLELQFDMANVMLFDIFMQEILHVEEEMSNYEGNTTVNVEGDGVFVWKFIVKPTLILSLFFWFEGMAKIEEKILVCVICKYMYPNDFYTPQPLLYVKIENVGVGCKLLGF